MCLRWALLPRAQRAPCPRPRAARCVVGGVVVVVIIISPRRRRRRRGRTAPSSPPLELRRTMELPRLATVCLVVATALAETVNFWASMANVCVEECGATRARDGVDDVRSRVRSRPIVALEMLSDPCVRARVVKKYRPPNPTSWRTECAYACGYRRMSERRVAPARANAPKAPRAAERARRRTRALPRRERARVE